MATTADPVQTIIDTAMELAEQRSWEAVRLYDVAQAADMSLDDIRVYFREKEDLADAWFDRADAALLQEAASAEFSRLSPRERLQRGIMTWLDTLAPHRRITRQIILNKCEPGHLHVQIPAILRISRTVQWLREAAQRDATFVHRALEETVLTTIFVTTFIHWLNDDSLNTVRTRELLTFLLKTAAGVERLLGLASSKGSIGMNRKTS